MKCVNKSCTRQVFTHVVCTLLSSRALVARERMLVMRVKSSDSRYLMKMHAVNVHTHACSEHACVKFKSSGTVATVVDRKMLTFRLRTNCVIRWENSVTANT